MGLDLSKIANQITTFSKSPAARRANEYSLKNAFMYQEMEAEQQKQADEAFINTTNTIQNIENTALNMAWREKDKAVLQENYKEHADNLKTTILEDYGGDITRFYQQGGRRHLQMFAMNVLNNPKAQIMAANTAQFAKYIEARNSSSSDDGRNIFNTVHENALQYQRGVVDEFSYGIDMIKYNKPPEDAFKSAPPNHTDAEVYLSHGGNYNAAVTNYRNEFGASEEDMENLAPEKLIEYIASYVGNSGRTNRVSDSSPKRLSNEIHNILESMGNVNASDIQSLEGFDTNYKKQLSALTEYTYYNPGEEVEGNIYGKEIFNDYLVELAGSFIDSDFTRANGYTEDGTVTLTEVDHASGGMYDVVGNKLEEGVTFGQGYFNSDQFEILGAMMGYKTIGGDERIMTYDEMHEINKGGADVKVKPVMLMALQEESTNMFGIGEESIVYKELLFDNLVKSKAFNDALKVDKNELASKVAEHADAYSQRIDDTPTFVGLKVTSAPKKLYNYAVHYDRKLNDKLKTLGIQKSDINTKALLLSFAHTIARNNDEITHDVVLDNLDRVFSISENPDMNDALQMNDMQTFLQVYMAQRRQADPSITQEEQNEMFAEVTELANAIRNSIIQTQKAK